MDREIDRLRDDLLRHLGVVRDEVRLGFDRLTERMDTANGRVNGLEKHQAADYVRLQLLEASVLRLQSSESGSPESKHSRRQTAITLSLGAGAGAGALELIKFVLGHL